jgi:hypothetical protein
MYLLRTGKGSKMMTTQKLKAMVNTVIKQSTLDSSHITDPTQKFSLTAADELEINDYKSAANNHWELELTTPVNQMAKWFAYIPHVEIKSNDPVAKILQDIKQSQFKVYHRPTEQDGDGVGIPPNGQDNRSERICPVYVLSPRRQTTDYTASGQGYSVHYCRTIATISRRLSPHYFSI